jgi:drug/metabolite transporter (DMT)-like permease
MIYTQMLFALFYDKVVWGNTLSPLSWAGSALIVGSALYVALVRDGKKNAAAAVAVDEAAEEGREPVA